MTFKSPYFLVRIKHGRSQTVMQVDLSIFFTTAMFKMQSFVNYTPHNAFQFPGCQVLVYSSHAQSLLLPDHSAISVPLWLASWILPGTRGILYDVLMCSEKRSTIKIQTQQSVYYISSDVPIYLFQGFYPLTVAKFPTISLLFPIPNYKFPNQYHWILSIFFDNLCKTFVLQLIIPTKLL